MSALISISAVVLFRYYYFGGIYSDHLELMNNFMLGSLAWVLNTGITSWVTNICEHLNINISLKDIFGLKKVTFGGENCIQKDNTPNKPKLVLNMDSANTDPQAGPSSQAGSSSQAGPSSQADPNTRTTVPCYKVHGSIPSYGNNFSVPIDPADISHLDNLFPKDGPLSQYEINYISSMNLETLWSYYITLDKDITRFSNEITKAKSTLEALEGKYGYYGVMDAMGKAPSYYIRYLENKAVYPHNNGERSGLVNNIQIFTTVREGNLYQARARMAFLGQRIAELNNNNNNSN
jgi:hypothetical protein